MINVTFPMRTVSEANRRGHWSKHAGRTKGQREAAGLMVICESQIKHSRHPSWLLSESEVATKLRALGMKLEAVLQVSIARLAPRSLDDDNLRGALKAVRDGVADALGIDDRDPRVTWLYAQEKAKSYFVRITITRREA